MKFANEAEHYKKEFERLLSYAVSISNGMIRPNVLQSGEIITDFTLGTEQKNTKSYRDKNQSKYNNARSRTT